MFKALSLLGRVFCLMFWAELRLTHTDSVSQAVVIPHLSPEIMTRMNASFAQQKPPGEDPPLRKNLGMWKLEPRDPSQGRLFCVVLEGHTGPRRHKSLRSGLRSALYVAELCVPCLGG